MEKVPYHGPLRNKHVADSTMFAEFIAIASVTNEAEWVRNLMFKIPLSNITCGNSYGLHNVFAKTL